jgi:TRAP-type C4-dicarboxylate transport system permease small subunit
MTRMAAVLRWISLAGSGLLFLGVLMTVVDIVLRHTIGSAVPGTVDLMQLIVMWAALAAVPYGFIANDHVAVDLLTEQFSAPVQRGLTVFSSLLGCIFLAAVFYFSTLQAWHEYGYGDRTQTIGIPIILYWLPMLAGMALSALATIAGGIAASCGVSLKPAEKQL